MINPVKTLAWALFPIVFSITTLGQVDPASRARFALDISGPDVSGFAKVTVGVFGAKGDGLTDDTGAIQTALDSVKSGSEVLFPEGTYLITRPVLIKRSRLYLHGQNAKIIFRPDSNSEMDLTGIKNGAITRFSVPQAAFMVMGALDGVKSWAAEAVQAGNNPIRLKDSSDGLAANDTIVVAAQDSGRVVERENANLSFYRELNFISKIEAVAAADREQLTLADPVSISFETESLPRIFKCRPVKDVLISGFDIRVDGEAGPYAGIVMAFSENSRIENVSVKSIHRSGISFYHCYRCGIYGNSIADARSYESAEGCGVTLNRSHFCAIKGNTASNLRHGIILDHGNGNCLIEGNAVMRCTTRASIDLHGEYNVFNTVRGNLITMGKTGIAIGGGGEVHYNDGPYNALINNFIAFCDFGLEICNESFPSIIGKNLFSNIAKKTIALNGVRIEDVIIYNCRF